jgi:hypothetical protein
VFRESYKPQNSFFFLSNISFVWNSVILKFLASALFKLYWFCCGLCLQTGSLFWLMNRQGSRRKLSATYFKGRSREFPWVTEKYHKNSSLRQPASGPRIEPRISWIWSRLLRTLFATFVILLETSVKRIISLRFWENEFFSLPLTIFTQKENDIEM